MRIAIRLITLALIVYSIKLLPTLKHEYLVIIILFYSHKNQFTVGFKKFMNMILQLLKPSPLDFIRLKV
jgi:hypothetical protein